MEDNNIIEVRVKPMHRMFFDENTFFSIYRCEVNQEDESKIELSNFKNISFKGITSELEFGQEYTVQLTKDTKTQYKGSYILENIKQDRPKTTSEQKKYFEAILTKNQVDAIYDYYSEGEDVIELITSGSFDYKNIRGFGDKTFEMLRTKVDKTIEMVEILAFISKYGIKYGAINKLLKEYGNARVVIELIEKNPYVLSEAKGIGFLTCDEIAKAMGHSMTSKARIEACIRYVLAQETTNGHSWMNYQKLFNSAVSMLNIDKKLVKKAIEDGIKGVKVVDERFTREEIYKAEEYIAHRIIGMATDCRKIFTDEELNEFLDLYCLNNGVELEKNQRQFFFDWNNHAVTVLIGGGGMGKSWLTKILIELIKKKSLKPCLLAPTGRASKVVSNYSGMPASTIHRKIGVRDSEDDSSNGEIWEDIIIVDETSMCDIFITKKLLESIKNSNARLLFVGDDFQLPSVGVGNFLYDIINSEAMKISKLTKTFRQKDGGILNVATDVREGKRFLNNTDEGMVKFGKDCLFHLTAQNYIRDGYIHYYKRLIKKHNPEDIVILSPTRKGKLGVGAINAEIQKIVNPASPTKKEKTFGKEEKEVTYRVGDMVMNLVNTREIETTVADRYTDIYNGDTGKIVGINEEEKHLLIDFEGEVVVMKFENVLKSLEHAWCTTIHKSQGSQYKVVIVICDKSMKFQLNANLLYTGFSRAKEFLIVLGQADAINHSIGKFANMERRSFLQELLQKYASNMATA